MREMISMVVVLTVLSAVSGGMLAGVKMGTKTRIENQVLKFQKAPAIKAILKDVTNDPLKDRFKIKDKDQEVTFFLGKHDGKPEDIAFETHGKGHEGPIGLMVAIDINSDKIVGVRVTTTTETPGMGTRANGDSPFAAQFAGKPLTTVFKVKTDGGDIDAISGATVTSQGICVAATQAKEIYMRLKPEIKKKIAKM